MIGKKSKKKFDVCLRESVCLNLKKERYKDREGTERQRKEKGHKKERGIYNEIETDRHWRQTREKEMNTDFIRKH